MVTPRLLLQLKSRNDATRFAAFMTLMNLHLSDSRRWRSVKLLPTAALVEWARRESDFAYWAKSSAGELSYFQLSRDAAATFRIPEAARRAARGDADVSMRVGLATVAACVRWARRNKPDAEGATLAYWAKLYHALPAWAKRVARTSAQPLPPPTSHTAITFVVRDTDRSFDAWRSLRSAWRVYTAAGGAL